MRIIPRRLFASLSSVLLIAATAPAEPDPRTTPFRSARLAPDLYLLQGTGGNVAAMIAPAGTILVDDDNAEAHPQLRTALRDIGADRVRYIINTHYHLDHAGGNAPFAAEGATILAEEAVVARLKAGAKVRVGPFEQVIPPVRPAELPTVGVAGSLALNTGMATVRAVHFPATHTDGDLVVYFDDHNIVHMGDIFVRYGFPFIDVPAGGRIDGMIKTSEAVLASIRADTRIIPGHGDVASPADLQAYVAMLKGTREAVAKAMAAGKSLAQIKADRVLAPWAQRYANAFISEDFFIETIYESLRLDGPPHIAAAVRRDDTPDGTTRH